MGKTRTTSKATALWLQLKQQRKPVYCRKCLEQVYQEEVEGKWGLVNFNGTQHKC